MGKPLKPGAILAVGTLGVATLLALAAVLLGRAGDAWRAGLTGGMLGLVLFGATAWALRPRGFSSPPALHRVERVSRRLGIAASAACAACIGLGRPGPVLVASFCGAFVGFFVATAVGMRLDSLKRAS